METKTVPFVDLSYQNRRILEEVTQRMGRVVQDSSFILGPEVEKFESEYAEFASVAHCVGVGNGTDALQLALEAVGIGCGDEVIVPANTFVATAEAVIRCGATVRLADVDDYFLIDPASVHAALSDRTRAVIAVDLFGQVPRIEEIRLLVGEEIHVIEDAAQSQGASRFDQSAGSFGTIAATSFYPGKNLGAWGDAGAVLTNVDELASTTRALRNHGGTAKYEHRIVGGNSRLDSLQAVVLSAKLKYLREWNCERQEAAKYYNILFADEPAIVTPSIAAGNSHSWHLYVIQVPDRDRLARALNSAGIGAGVHYPMPIHLIPAFAAQDLGGIGRYPRAEEKASLILSLPMFPGMSRFQQDQVASILKANL